MNKTKKRAIQKHRAKAFKFDARDKANATSDGASTVSPPKPSMSAPAKQRAVTKAAAEAADQSESAPAD